MATPPQPQIPQSLSRDPSKSRTPLPLSASQEQQVRDIYYKKVRTICADEIRGRSIGVITVMKQDLDSVHIQAYPNPSSPSRAPRPRLQYQAINT